MEWSGDVVVTDGGDARDKRIRALEERAEQAERRVRELQVASAARAQQEQLAEQQRLTNAYAVRDAVGALADAIADFRAHGGTVNLRVHHDNGCESIDLCDLTGELELGLTLRLTLPEEEEDNDGA